MIPAPPAADQSAPRPVAVVVMGVCGAGKTEVGRRLAAALGWEFRDADEFHPPANVAKMRAGTPLDDADRRPWLDALAGLLARAVDEHNGTVLACSALARRYRERLRLPHLRILLVHFDGAAGASRKRVEQRA
ncbi:MAG: gluconokinase, partial [Planctomycetia bacterium]